jgi:hydrogenase maturation protease
MKENRILVLGVGNTLLQDEGVGVRVVERLADGYRFSSNVELMDGGTQGIKLLEPVSSCDRLIVVDAVAGGGSPGTVYRLSGEDLKKSLTFKNSMHEFDLVETLACAEVLGNSPAAVIVGIEPEEVSPWGLELSPAVAAGLPDLERAVLEEIADAGGEFWSASDAAEMGIGG